MALQIPPHAFHRRPLPSSQVLGDAMMDHAQLLATLARTAGYLITVADHRRIKPAEMRKMQRFLRSAAKEADRLAMLIEG